MRGEWTRRSVVSTALGAALLPGAARPARAQADYPSHPIRVYIGYPPGAGADIVSRLFADKVSAKAGQPLVIYNRPGAFGVVAFQETGAAAPDGYSVLWTGSSIMAGGKYLVRSMPYDPARDFRPIAGFADFPFVMVVGAPSQARSIGDLVQLSKSRRLLYGYSNAPAYLATEYLKTQVPIVADPVAYRGASDAVRDLQGGAIDFMVMDGAFAVGAVKAGTVRAIAVTSQDRVPVLASVPTLKEAGISGFSFSPWWGAWLPAATPPAIASKFAGWFAATAHDPALAASLHDLAVLPIFLTAEQVDRRVQDDAAIWNKLAARAGLKPA